MANWLGLLALPLCILTAAILAAGGASLVGSPAQSPAVGIIVSLAPTPEEVVAEASSLAQPTRLPETALSALPPVEGEGEFAAAPPQEPQRAPFPERDESRLYVEYVVQPGDSLGIIADHYEVSIDDLFWSNASLVDVDMVVEGTVLKVPSLDGIVHHSVGGETVYDIAVKYGVSVESLTWFAANTAGDPWQTLEDGREVLVLHASPPIADDAPPPAEAAPEVGPSAAAEPVATLPPPSDAGQPPMEEAQPAEPVPASACVPTRDNAPCFIWPVDGPITSAFGPRSDVGFHDGIDIDVPNDGNHRPIAAAAAGDVIWSGCDNSGYGCYVILDHGFGWKTRYDHFSALYVEARQRVEQGIILGLSGCTGMCYGEHLHFAILFEGRAVDPIHYLPPK
ncbi:MAG: peptidoglycan DD-metalloendopeptidase family protein [Dehalococcoidia bacterium]|nr:peptidoglycan DD-metalloendopeptidase family protein [Dehalococcoidia bacterium]